MSSCHNLIKTNATDFERTFEHVICETAPEISAVSGLYDPKTCAPQYLRHLAWVFAVDVWDETWPEVTKREVIGGALEVHRHKGTVASVKRSLLNAGYGNAEIIERFGDELYDGSIQFDGSKTYSSSDHWAEYRVKITRPITQEQAAQIRAILKAVTPAHCHLKSLDFQDVQHSYNYTIQYDGQFTFGEA